MEWDRVQSLTFSVRDWMHIHPVPVFQSLLSQIFLLGWNPVLFSSLDLGSQLLVTYPVVRASGMQVLLSPLFLNDPNNRALRAKYELGSSKQVRTQGRILQKSIWAAVPVATSYETFSWSQRRHQITVALKDNISLLAFFFAFSAALLLFHMWAALNEMWPILCVFINGARQLRSVMGSLVSQVV